MARLTGVLAVVFTVALGGIASAEEPAPQSPTRALADIVDCLAEALTGTGRAAPQQVAAVGGERGSVPSGN